MDDARIVRTSQGISSPSNPPIGRAAVSKPLHRHRRLFSVGVCLLAMGLIGWGGWELASSGSGNFNRVPPELDLQTANDQEDRKTQIEKMASAIHAAGNVSSEALPGRGPQSDSAEKSIATDLGYQQGGDQKHRGQLEGTWVQSNLGLRQLLVKGDGTAKMIVQPDAPWSYILGGRLEIDIHWNLKGDQLTFESIGGRPESKFQLATQMWGTHRQYQIVSLIDSELLLRNEDGELCKPWTRAEAGSEGESD